MLSRLYIRNVAVIEKAEIELGAGFNVFTGETGAGKSMLINSMNAITGGRISKDIIRTGADKAVMTAEFEGVSEKKLAALEEKGYDTEDGTVVISRSVGTDGKSVCRINGQPATVGDLKEFAEGVLDIYGQHDSRALTDVGEHIRFVDFYGELGGDVADYNGSYVKMKEMLAELDGLKEDEADKQQRKEFLEYQVKEITAAQLREGEEEELVRQRDIIKNAEKLEKIFGRAREAALGDDDGRNGAVAELEKFADSTEELAEFYPELKKSAERLREIYYETEEIYNDLRGLNGGEDFDPARLDLIEDRIALIRSLEKKYGAEIKDVLEFADNAGKKLETIENSEEMIAELEKRYEAAKAEVLDKAERLSKKRKAAAVKFTKAVAEELEFLDMPNVKLVADISKAELSHGGSDRVEFLISANPGEEPRPMAKVASGGELSRIMLSIKNALADKDEIATMVFDEVDTGVSGRAAYKIGKKLKSVSEGRQVICVTHLAQVASFADEHKLIRKDVHDGRAFTEIVSLDKEARVREVARISGGEVLTEAQLASAREMLENSRED